MIEYITDPIICISTGISLSILWITAHDVYSNRYKPIKFKDIFLNNAFIIGLSVGIMFCYYGKVPLVYIMFPKFAH